MPFASNVGVLFDTWISDLLGLRVSKNGVGLLQCPVQAPLLSQLLSLSMKWLRFGLLLLSALCVGPEWVRALEPATPFGMQGHALPAYGSPDYDWAKVCARGGQLTTCFDATHGLLSGLLCCWVLLSVTLYVIRASPPPCPSPPCVHPPPQGGNRHLAHEQ